MWENFILIHYTENSNSLRPDFSQNLNKNDKLRRPGRQASEEALLRQQFIIPEYFYLTTQLMRFNNSGQIPLNEPGHHMRLSPYLRPL